MLRYLKSRVRRRPPGDAAISLATSSERPPEVLVVLESGSPTERMALLDPLRRLGRDVPFAIAAPGALPLPDDLGLGADPWRRSDTGELQALSAHIPRVLALGHFLQLSRLVFAARSRARPLTVVQHGLLTPSAPPLPDGCVLLAWSAADASFWRSDRSDVTTHVVGSQLLHRAHAGASQQHVSRFIAPTFLGQLHGAELPRTGMSRAATEFCLREHASYRPHPSETDRLSVLQHRIWERMGIDIDRSGVPLVELQRPVVSAFSTGVLEAAARGVPSWVFYPDAPPWLTEFWARYGMHRWGESPTPAPTQSAIEPAQAIADWIKEHL